MHILSFVCTPNPTAKTVEVTLLVDGQSPSGDLVDVLGFLYGGHLDGVSYDVYTCSCGNSGCAGFHAPIEQTRDAQSVRWLVEDDKLAHLLGAQEVIFDAAAFDAACADLRTALLAYEAQGLHAEDLAGAFHDEDDEPSPIVLASIAAHQEAYFAGQVAMSDAKRKASDPTNPAPVRTTWNGYDRNGAINPAPRMQTMSSVDAAAQLLNMDHVLQASEAERASVLPEAAAIVRAFVATADAGVANAAFAPLRRFMAADDVDRPEQDLFMVDADGPFVSIPQ